MSHPLPRFAEPEPSRISLSGFPGCARATTARLHPHPTPAQRGGAARAGSSRTRTPPRRRVRRGLPGGVHPATAGRTPVRPGDARQDRECGAPGDRTYLRRGPALDGEQILTGVNVARIGETDARTDGTFLFNHFTAAPGTDAEAVWRSLTGWYTTKTGVDNSTALRPTGPSPFALINYARIPAGAIRFLFGQLTRPSFHRFVPSTTTECTPAPFTVDPRVDGASTEGTSSSTALPASPASASSSS